jgi:hypothetical protein
MIGGKLWPDEQRAIHVREWLQGKRLLSPEASRDVYVDLIYGWDLQQGGGDWVWVLESEDSDSVVEDKPEEEFVKNYFGKDWDTPVDERFARLLICGRGLG